MSSGRETYLNHLYDSIVKPVQSYVINTDMNEYSIATEPQSEQIYDDNNHT